MMHSTTASSRHLIGDRRDHRNAMLATLAAVDVGRLLAPGRFHRADCRRAGGHRLARRGCHRRVGPSLVHRLAAGRLGTDHRTAWPVAHAARWRARSETDHRGAEGLHRLWPGRAAGRVAASGLRQQPTGLSDLCRRHRRRQPHHAGPRPTRRHASDRRGGAVRERRQQERRPALRLAHRLAAGWHAVDEHRRRRQPTGVVRRRRHPQAGTEARYALRQGAAAARRWQRAARTIRS